MIRVSIIDALVPRNPNDWAEWCSSPPRWVDRLERYHAMRAVVERGWPC